jgi:hypothetical protein
MCLENNAYLSLLSNILHLEKSFASFVFFVWSAIVGSLFSEQENKPKSIIIQNTFLFA